jgi:DNA-binding FrmR family transcriptional regulator
VIDDIKKRALHRTKIIEGQLRGIEKMIENEDYCVDIHHAVSLAVQKSLGSLNKLLVENHLRTPRERDVRGGRRATRRRGRGAAAHLRAVEQPGVAERMRGRTPADALADGPLVLDGGARHALDERGAESRVRPLERAPCSTDRPSPCSIVTA